MKTTSILPLLLLAANMVSAGAIFLPGNNPQTDEPVLFHDSCTGCVDGPANTVIGHLQSSDILVDLNSTNQLVAVDPGHNAVSTPGDAGFNNLSIVLPGYTFTSIILQLSELSSVTDGTVIFTAHTLADGNFTSSVLPVSHTGGGQNFYTITTNSGTLITQLDLSTSLLQHDVSQIRIGGAAGAVPEPASYGMVGTALVALIFFRSRLGR
ncbi:MAG TPA: hypothetical protein VLM42_07610 [Bryobacteraceae bacterium]|nr:hypothetical protein [Bryobacteraceae bacterium]